ncbi:MAG: hypothetical protein KKA19_04705 [Candidatus Margulisbacteria bacterium]|nr:hypothetical protein [Candidatus Margulisiibacteriota bacterium]
MGYEFKLAIDWQQKAEEKIDIWVNNKRKRVARLTKKQIKEITKNIVNSDVIEQNENYTVYRLRV